MTSTKMSKRIIARTVMFAAPLIVLTAAALTCCYHINAQKLDALLGREVRDEALFLKRNVETVMGHILSDIRYLANYGTAMKPGNKYGADCQSAYLKFISSKPDSLSIRALDSTGFEAFRIDRSSGIPTTTTADEHPDRVNDFGFTGIEDGWEEGIHVSRFILGRWHGTGTDKPLLRFAIPFHDDENNLKRVLVLSNSGEGILSLFETGGHSGDIATHLLSGEGHWLKANSPGKEWGNMFKNRKDASFANSFPDEWASIAHSEEGILQTTNGIFAFATVNPAMVIDRHSSPGTGLAAETWKIVTSMPAEEIAGMLHPTTVGFISFFCAVSLLIAGGTYGLVRLYENNRLARLTILEEHVSSERFVPREFLNLMGKGRLREIELSQCVQKDMSVLFSDIRSYTKLSESMPPKEIFELLNNYFSRIDTAITARQGFIDKYIGDAVMALFPGATDNALRAAIAMRNRIDMFNLQQKQDGKPIIHTGFGLHYGEVSLGSIGTMRRLQTTAIGDTVNLAARIESATKTFNVNIILSDAFYDRLEHPDMFRLRKIDTVRVKGKDRPVTLYEAYDTDDAELAILKDETRDDLKRGLELYAAGDFDGALDCFERCRERCPEDSIPPIYAKRCNTMKRIRPGDDWTGVNTL